MYSLEVLVACTTLPETDITMDLKPRKELGMLIQHVILIMLMQKQQESY